MEAPLMIPKRENPDLERMLAIAAISAAAGEALPEIETFARGELVAVPYKYGMHLPNWFNGDSPGLRREVEATLPISLTYLDNVKGEGLDPQIEILHRNGVKPVLVFRPYFRPDDGVNPAIVEGYAQGAVTRMRDDYLQHPLIRQAYDEGRFIVKFFNETNIGGEGFARGRAGFVEALRYWKQARAIMKAAYPKARILSLCNTPGNDDVWFSGDTANAHYWYHGPEAAKANPTQAEINRAVQTCLFREMFELCDDIGTHVYANTRETVEGNLATWFSRRHEQALKFLQPYISAGKRLIINEWDMGYDDGQEYRARGVAYALEHIIGPNDAILFVSQWWNGDKGEGSFAWDKHRTREDGVLLPVVHAVAAFRAGASLPDNPGGTGGTGGAGGEQPTGEIRLPEWVRVDRAVVPVGQKYWQLKQAYWQDSHESGGTHHIYALNPHDGAVEMLVKWGTATDRVKLEKPQSEPAGNYAMFGAEYSAQLEGRGVTLSDKVSGMKMPQNQHVSYFLEWELATKEGEVPVPTDWKTALMDNLDAAQLSKGIRLNPNAAIQKVIFAQGFVPVVGEVPFVHPDKSLPATQKAERLADNAKRYYSWSAAEGVKWYERGGAVLIDAPYYSQVEARWSANDCGAATMAMKLHARTGKAQNVDLLAQEASQIQGEDGANFAALKWETLEILGQIHGVPLVRATQATWERTQEALRGYLAKDKTVTLLVHYDALPMANRREKVNGKVKGHYLEAKGYDADGIVYNDPYHAGRNGENLRLTWAQLRKAWEENPKDNNAAYSMRA